MERFWSIRLLAAIAVFSAIALSAGCSADSTPGAQKPTEGQSRAPSVKAETQTRPVATGGEKLASPARETPDAPVRSMQLLSPAQGWALTNRQLAWTDDGGLTWEEITPRGVSVSNIRGVWFLDARHAWAIASGTADATGATNLVAFRTDDGGKTWLSRSITPADPSYTDSAGAPVFISFVDANNGWAMVKLVSGSNFGLGDLFQTTDGGITWTRRSAPIGDPIRFTSPTVGWVAGGPEGDKLYVTDDGGVTWQPQEVDLSALGSSRPVYHLPELSPNGSGVLPVSYADSPARVTFYTSGDGGKSWTIGASVVSRQQVGQGVRIPVDIVDSNTWVVATPDGARLFRARDEGKSWDLVAPNGLPEGVISINFATDDIGWALARSGNCADSKIDCEHHTELLKTVDGGQTWTRLKP